jgi:hypothetical protein
MRSCLTHPTPQAVLDAAHTIAAWLREIEAAEALVAPSGGVAFHATHHTADALDGWEGARAWSRLWKTRAKINRRAWRAMLAMQDEGIAARVLLRCNDRREVNARRALHYRRQVRELRAEAIQAIVAVTGEGPRWREELLDEITHYIEQAHERDATGSMLYRFLRTVGRSLLTTTTTVGRAEAAADRARIGDLS